MNPLFSVGYLPGEKELRTSGQQVLDFVSAVDPAQGIMRGMAASGRAFDSELSDEERKAAGIEAALETLAPVGMGVIGALAKQPAKAVLMDTLTLTGAPSDAVPVPPKTSDGPTRRQVLAGIGSLAVAPEAVLQAGKKVGVKAALTPLASRLAGLKAIDKFMLDKSDLPPVEKFELGDKYLKESVSMFDEVADASLSEIAKLDIDSLLIIHGQDHLASGRVSQEKLDAIEDMVMSKVEQMPDRFKIGEANGKKFILRDMNDNFDEDYRDFEIPFADGGSVASRLTGLGSMGYMI